ncbi:MAG TPA: NIPSNAP family protein [Hyphomicrobiaceae bacterium]|jgi:NIPSNAP|nr:NIPSNAP family protein [Hyphomicrobiaceae bacterium]
MIVDVRTYTLIPRKMPKYLELFEAHALPVMRRHNLELMGYYVSQIGPLNQVVHLWRYASLADLEQKRAARDADPDWAAFLARTEGMVLVQDNKIMRPATFSPPH